LIDAIITMPSDIDRSSNDILMYKNITIVINIYIYIYIYIHIYITIKNTFFLIAISKIKILEK